MSSLAHKQATTHPNGHDEGVVCEEDQIKIPLRLIDDPEKCTAVPSDCRDLESDTPGPVASRTRRKSRLDSDVEPAVDGYVGGNISSETDVPAVDETVRARLNDASSDVEDTDDNIEVNRGVKDPPATNILGIRSGGDQRVRCYRVVSGRSRNCI